MARTAAQFVARKAGQGSSWIRRDKRLALYLRDDCTCAYCGNNVIPGIDATLDHVLACELGGNNHEGNLVTCCLSCNSSKRDLTVRAWFAHLRSNGADTDGMADRIRTATGRNLKAYRATARQVLAAGAYADAMACAARLAA